MGSTVRGVADSQSQGLFFAEGQADVYVAEQHSRTPAVGSQSCGSSLPRVGIGTTPSGVMIVARQSQARPRTVRGFVSFTRARTVVVLASGNNLATRPENVAVLAVHGKVCCPVLPNP